MARYAPPNGALAAMNQKVFNEDNLKCNTRPPWCNVRAME